jgi:hypothetical protein
MNLKEIIKIAIVIILSFGAGLFIYYNFVYGVPLTSMAEWWIRIAFAAIGEYFLEEPVLRILKK